MSVRVHELTSPLTGDDIDLLPDYEAPNLLNVIDWGIAFWAGDPDQTPPADGADITSWRDGSGNGRDFTLVSATEPTYDDAHTALNGQPAAVFTSGTYLKAAGFSIPATHSIVVVGKVDSLAARAFAGYWNSGGTNDGYLGISSGGKWHMNSGTSMNSAGNADTAKHLVVAVTDASGDDRIEVDGTTVVTGNAGGSSVGHFVLGQGHNTAGTGTASLAGQIGFAAAVPGDVTTDPGWPYFVAMVEELYGLTVA